MRIAILGAGAIGSAVGALLARDGHEVTLVGRPDHVRAIREGGLRVDGVMGSFKVPVAASTTLEASPDLALLAVKTQDVESTLRAYRDRLEHIPVVTMQNGVRSDAMAESVLPAENLLSSVVVVTATYLVPGQVTLVDRGYLVLGRPHGPRDGLVAQVASVLDRSIPVSISDNMVGSHWLKLLMNLNNAIPALTNLTLREVTRNAFLRRLAIGLMREGMAVSEAAGVTLAPLKGVSVGTIRMVTRLPTPLASRIFALRASSLGGEWPILGSTLQSLRRGRPTEIDYLNGEIVRRGGEVGIPTPLNAKVIELVHDVERTGRFYQPAALRQALTHPGAG